MSSNSIRDESGKGKIKGTNRKALADAYKQIEGTLSQRIGKGAVRKLVPFLGGKIFPEDSEALSAYYDSLATYQSNIINDDSEYDFVKNYHKKGILGIGGLKNTLKKSSKHRSKVLKDDVRESNRFIKHLFDTKNERITALKQQETQMNTLIGQAKKEYHMAKQAGASKKELKKLYGEIAKYKKDKNYNVTSRLRGYGISGLEDSINTAKVNIAKLEKTSYGKINSAINKAKMQGRSDAVLARLDRYKGYLKDKNGKELTGAHAELNALESAEKNRLGNKRYDFTLRNMGGIGKAMIDNPSLIGSMVRGAVMTLAKSSPVLFAGILYGAYATLIAPTLFGDGRFGGTKLGTQVYGTDLRTGLQKKVTIPKTLDTGGVLQGNDWGTRFENKFRTPIEGVNNLIEHDIQGTSAARAKQEKKWHHLDQPNSPLEVNSIDKSQISEIMRIATSTGADPALAYALMKTESSYNPNAVAHTESKGDSRGLFQINDSNLAWIQQNTPEFKDLTIDDMRKRSFNPNDNALMFATYYKIYLAKYGKNDTEKMLRHMGLGPEVVKGVKTVSALKRKIEAYNNAKKATGQEPMSVLVGDTEIQKGATVVPDFQVGPQAYNVMSKFDNAPDRPAQVAVNNFNKIEATPTTAPSENDTTELASHISNMIYINETYN